MEYSHALKKGPLYLLMSYETEYLGIFSEEQLIYFPLISLTFSKVKMFPWSWFPPVSPL